MMSKVFTSVNRCAPSSSQSSYVEVTFLHHLLEYDAWAQLPLARMCADIIYGRRGFTQHASGKTTTSMSISFGWISLRNDFHAAPVK